MFYITVCEDVQISQTGFRTPVTVGNMYVPGCKAEMEAHELNKK